MKDETNRITWSQAIEKAIIELGYIATLKQIYEVAPKYKRFTGLTPDRTINERVQRDSNFVRLKPGLYGLKNYLDRLPDIYNPKIKKTEAENLQITHSYIQGLLLEIGNINGFSTFAPDKGRPFLSKKLGDIMTCSEVPKFTFDSIIQSTKFIDVIWFNERNFPNTIFEIENSTNFRNSLVKFVELQDFKTSMIIIAPENSGKKDKFRQEIKKSAFQSIRDRVKFYDYGFVENLYNSQIESLKYKSFFN